jgi:membrane complex biogenesis BtpA family protein
VGKKKLFKMIFRTDKPIIGMVHLKPLPGAPKYDSESGIQGIVDAAMDDTSRLVKGGIDGVMVENQWDRPWLKPDEIGPETVATMASVLQQIRDSHNIPMGVNVHLNGVCQAIAIALATGCQFIRAFELANAYISSAGIIEAAAPKAIRYRACLNAEDKIFIFADFHVKHGSHQIISDKSSEEQAEDIEEAMGDAVIITGIKTGNPPARGDIELIRKVVNIPILIGSGLKVENLEDLFPLVDGAIVGSYFKEGGELNNPIDVDRVKRFTGIVKQLRK